MFVKKDNLIYEVQKPYTLGTHDVCTCYHLDLVCGYDIVNCNTGLEGWISKKAFVESVQCDEILVYPEETFEKNLILEGFELIENLPNEIYPYYIENN